MTTTDHGPAMSEDKQSVVFNSPAKRIPRGALIASAVTGRPIPRRHIAHVSAMLGEQHSVNAFRDPLDFAAAEKITRSTVEKKANAAVTERVRVELEPIVTRVRTLVQERNTYQRERDRLDHDPLVGPHGESLNQVEARRRHDELAGRIQSDSDSESTVHRRFDPRSRTLVSRLVWLDLPIFVYFMMGALNIGITTFFYDVGGWIRMVFAVAFGLFGTLAAARGLKILGARHRGFKNRHDQWSAPKGGRTQLVLELGFVAAMIGGIAVLMAYRVSTDVLESEQPLVLALVVGVVLAIASALLNYVVYLSEFRDGSTTTEQVDALASSLDRIKRDQQHNDGLINITDEEIDKQITLGYRTGEWIRSEALAAVTGSRADTAIRYARSIHQGVGHSDRLPIPELDFSTLAVALHHLSTLEAAHLVNMHPTRQES